MESPKQWQCPECQQWVDSGYSTHVHTKTREPSLDEMLLARRMTEMGRTVDALQDITGERTTYFRTGKEPTREKPL